MEEKKDVLELILSGEQLTRKVKTKRGTFVIAFPLPKDLREIEINTVRMMDGLPADSFTKDQLATFRAYATLEKIIVEAPEWWKNLESSEDCPDDNLITFLYGRYLHFYKSTQKAIGESGFARSSGGSGAKAKGKAVDN